ncbi:MAG: hypothetical protein AB7G28_25780 [Pirellulales bacterium]
MSVESSADLTPDEPSDLEPENEESTDASDLELPEVPATDEDDARWEAFIPDDDQSDPQPEPGDFWIEDCIRLAA